MRAIAIEEAFTHPPVRQAADRFGPFRDQAHWRDIEKKLEDLGETRLADMDAAGIDVQVISHTPPGPESLAPVQARILAREANDALAQAVAAHPDRFAGFAALPMSDPAAAADELERAVKVLGFRGALVNGMVQDRFLDHPVFEPVLARAESLGVPLYIHPSFPPQSVMDAYYGGLDPLHSLFMSTAAWGWHSETGVHTLRMIISGVFDRHPGLQLIIGHMGEMLPFMLARADHVLTPVSPKLRQRVADYFQTNIWITTSGFFTHAPFQCAMSVIGASRILFAVDYPFSTNRAGRAFLDSAAISEADRAKIAHGNAEHLLRL
ncbi:MAG TPA: amidohydrolase family protein [Micropepsaceae bacterium]|nr:amidohydrolase family protein [Micropepsaceae bacterium]